MTLRPPSLVLCACALLLQSGALANAQLPATIPKEKEPPAPQDRMRDQRLPLTVSGCLRGNRLLLSPRGVTADLLNAEDLVLEGPKDLMQLLRQHDNHQDELTGVAILKQPPDGSSTTDVHTKPVGKKGRLTSGVRESEGVTTDVRQLVRFRVSGISHLHEGCTGF